jgi:hypothetical protein
MVHHSPQQNRTNESYPEPSTYDLDFQALSIHKSRMCTSIRLAYEGFKFVGKCSAKWIDIELQA